jgi:hypothetical protein
MAIFSRVIILQMLPFFCGHMHWHVHYYPTAFWLAALSGSGASFF